MTPAEIADLVRRARHDPPPIPERLIKRKRSGKHTADSLSDATIRAILGAESDAAVRRICKVALQGSNAETRRRMRGRLATIINFRNDPRPMSATRWPDLSDAEYKLRATMDEAILILRGAADLAGRSEFPLADAAEALGIPWASEAFKTARAARDRVRPDTETLIHCVLRFKFKRDLELLRNAYLEAAARLSGHPRL